MDRITPTTRMCVTDCGSLCCRTAHWIVLSSEDLASLTWHLHDVPERPGRPWVDYSPRQGWVFSFDVCPFLDEEGYCRIYHDRPTGCRDFPVRPEAGCLAWPSSGLQALEQG